MRAILVLLASCSAIEATPDSGSDAGKPFDAGADAGMVPPIDAGRRIWLEETFLQWERAPLEGYRTLADRFSGGVCAIDADGAPPLDLFFAARTDSRLFVDREDRTADFGLEIGDAIGCLAFDAEGDGDDDLLVTVVGGVELHLNDGARFRRSDAFFAAFDPLGIYTSAAAGDVDGDRDLDLLIGGYLRIDPSIDPAEICPGTIPCTAELARHQPIGNVLLIREGVRYEDRTAALAPELAIPEPTLVVAIGDFLEQGAPALYAGNDLGARYFDRMLARRADGTFADVPAAGFATNGRGYGIDTMGLASGDLDRDGALEHAVTSFEGDATALFDCAAPAVCEDRGRVIGMSESAHTFRWANTFVDLDLDGFPEIVEATGHYYTEGELVGFMFDGPVAQRPNVLANSGGAFSPLDAGLTPAQMRGLTRTDLDEDGRADIVLAPVIGAPMLLRTAWPDHGRALRVVLRGRPPNTRAIGALVRVEHDGAVQAAEARAGEGYLGSFDPRLYFGLGSSTRASVRVRWPSGVETMTAIEADEGEVIIAEPALP